MPDKVYCFAQKRINRDRHGLWPFGSIKSPQPNKPKEIIEPCPITLYSLTRTQ